MVKRRSERRGVVYGLVVMGQGEGGILPVESIAIPGTGKLKLTGSLGQVCYFLSFFSYAQMLIFSARFRTTNFIISLPQVWEIINDMSNHRRVDLV
jgi:ATP-dependent Lon protease